MKLVKLGELFNISSGGTPSRKNMEYYEGGTIPWVKTSDLKSKVILETPEKITSLGLKYSSAKLFPPKTVLVAMYGATIGACAILDAQASTNQACAAFLPNEKANEEYLYYYFKAIQNQLVWLGQGGGQPNISAKILKAVKIPIPDKFGDQTRIATLLSKVESLIAKRKKSIADLDELLKSTFGEMFSIKGEGFKKWEIDNLSKHSEIVSGVAKGKKYNKTKLIEIPYLRVANVQDGFLNLDEVKTIFVSEREIEKCLLRSGDVLLTEGGDPDKLGRGSVWEGPIDGCIHQNHIFRVRINNNKVLNPKYLSGLIGSVYGKSYFLKSAKQTTGIASINSTQLKKFPVILPPINLQNKFADIVEKVESLKEKYQKILNDFESLYGALSHKAFKGELDLTRIPVVHDLGVESGLGFETIVGELTVQGKSDKAPETREQVLHRLFKGFISDAKNGALSLDDFWLEAEEKLIDVMDEDEPSLGVADYDRVKDWLFDMLAQGKVSQVFNEQENRMEIRPVP